MQSKTLNPIASFTGDWISVQNAERDPEPTSDRVSRLAYSRYEQRGRVDGHDLEDWLEAERELTRDLA